jgi:hypothetical protein
MILTEGDDRAVVFALGLCLCYRGDHQVTYSAKGGMSVSGHLITFYESKQCSGTGTYKWSLRKGHLRFVQAAGSSDLCLREPILTSRTWTHR